MQNDDKIYGLIAQAEDIQKHAVALQRSAQDAIKTLPDASRAAVRDAAREFITEGAEKASKGLLDASREAKEAAAELRGAQITVLLKHIICLVLVAVVLCGALWAGLGFMVRKRAADLDALSVQVSAHRAALDELKSQTWGLELITFREGGRGVILPKGQQFERIANMQDGRSVAILK